MIDYNLVLSGLSQCIISANMNVETHAFIN
jgi:hypothetical protein